MEDLGVLDRFLNVFNLYIDNGFGLLGGEVGFLTGILIAIDITLAGLLWAWGDSEDIIAKFIRKVLYIGAFAFILNNFADLSSIILRSFAGLGLTATGTGLTAGELLRPGALAATGVDAARPLLDRMNDLSGFPDVFTNLITILVLFLSWLLVILSFFILAIQLFVTLIEFKLTTLAGFVLVPFALWNKTAFLAEKVLGNVVSAGIKVLVLAVIIGIGTQIFGEFTAPPVGEFTINHALAIALGSLAMLFLGMFGPAIATGLVSGAPQLGAGAGASAMLVGGGVAVGSAAAVVRGAQMAFGRSSATTPAGGTSGNSPPPPPSPSGLSPSGGSPQRSPPSGSSWTGPTATPGWAERLKSRGSTAHALMTSANALRATDHGGHGVSPHLTKDN